MGLRIRTNVEALTAQRYLSDNHTSMNSSMNKLSSGQRITKSADDAAGMAISETLRTKIRSLGQAKRNANDAISLTQAAEGSVSEMTNILTRMRELTIQAASDTVGQRERGYLNKEYQELLQEIDRISATSEFNGRKLLDDGAAEQPIMIQVGYHGTEQDVLKIPLGEFEEGINTESLDLADTSLNHEDREDIVENIQKIDKAVDMISMTRATIGSVQSRVTSTIADLSTHIETMNAANSRIRDVDYAEETSKLAQSRLLTQAGLAILSQANQKPDMALSLLRS